MGKSPLYEKVKLVYNVGKFVIREGVAMNCAKCGREIQEGQVFCPICLEEMEGYPVKPGIVVHIPKRVDEEDDKTSLSWKRPVLSPEEQVRKLKKKLLWLRLAVATLLIAGGVLCFILGKAVTELDVRGIIGQNYSTVESGTNKATRIPGKP